MVTTRLSSVSRSIAGASSFVHWSRRPRNAARTTVPEGRCWGNATGERGARPPLVGTIFISCKHPRPTPTLPSNWIIGNHLDAHCPRVPTHSEVCRQTTAKLHQYIFRYNAPCPRRFSMITLFLIEIEDSRIRSPGPNGRSPTVGNRRRRVITGRYRCRIGRTIPPNSKTTSLHCKNLIQIHYIDKNKMRTF